MQLVSRWKDIRRSLYESPGALTLGEHLSRTALDILGADRVSITLILSDEFVVLAATVVVDTAEKITLARWPVFGPTLSTAGIGSLLCFPLVVGAAHIGAISSYRDTPWSPDPDTYTDGLVLAALITEIVLRMQAGWADNGKLDEIEPSLRDRAVVNQAAGMTAEQLGIGIAEASIRLRAHAFATGQPLVVLARRVVSGETALEP